MNISQYDPERHQSAWLSVRDHLSRCGCPLDSGIVPEWHMKDASKDMFLLTTGAVLSVSFHTQVNQKSELIYRVMAVEVRHGDPVSIAVENYASFAIGQPHEENR